MSLQNNIWSYLRLLFHPYDGTKDSGGTTIDLDTNLRMPWRFPVCYRKDSADGLAATETAATYFWYAPRAAKIVSAHITPTGTLTADDTHYKTIYVKNSAGTTLCSVTTKKAAAGGTGDWAAGAEEAMTINSPSVAAGETLSLSIAKSGDGVVVPISSVVLEVEWV